MITKKQAGVIYRNWKLGNIKAEQADMNYMYAVVDGKVSPFKAENAYYALKNCVDFIFSGDFESANVSFSNFANC